MLYGDYGGDGTWTTFVRTGTLDEESQKSARPEAHIWTSTKLDWVDLSSERERGVPILEERYQKAKVWRKDALERSELLRQRKEAAKKAEEAAARGR